MKGRRHVYLLHTYLYNSFPYIIPDVPSVEKTIDRLAAKREEILALE